MFLSHSQGFQVWAGCRAYSKAGMPALHRMKRMSSARNVSGPARHVLGGCTFNKRGHPNSNFSLSWCVFGGGGGGWGVSCFFLSSCLLSIQSFVRFENWASFQNLLLSTKQMIRPGMFTMPSETRPPMLQAELTPFDLFYQEHLRRTRVLPLHLLNMSSQFHVTA